MGKLVNFERRNAPPAAADKPRGTAQILIFTGVRYERGAPPPSTRLDPTPRKRKRG
ncbi:hypothetical protein [Devosia sp. RR2S18]|uniref:hypothetical protein n=1 Tax=Devosia rhizosphaerae TaxID=3049774 RepID=UPI002540A4B0|nr:hypothetical protein [Devosia sp. RR2S18]WIJ24393.1 hypothetical protein QOV41_15415 [Devosia sp. RR2S18]HEV7293622.1 hypothetical protein [Devosia sp.]